MSRDSSMARIRSERLEHLAADLLSDNVTLYITRTQLMTSLDLTPLGAEDEDSQSLQALRGDRAHKIDIFPNIVKLRPTNAGLQAVARFLI